MLEVVCICVSVCGIMPSDDLDIVFFFFNLSVFTQLEEIWLAVQNNQLISA